MFGRMRQKFNVLKGKVKIPMFGRRRPEFQCLKA